MAKDAYKQALEVGDNNLIVSAQENLNNAQNDANSLKLLNNNMSLKNL